MNCPTCGNSIQVGSRVCNRCGGQINYPPNDYARNNIPKKHAKHTVWMIGIITALLSLGAVIALILFNSGQTMQTTGITDDSASFSTEIPPGFVFDDTAVVEVVGEQIQTPTVTGIAPVSGTVGAKVQITGSNLIGTGLQKVKLGESEMNLYAVSEDSIEALVPYNTQSGTISLVYENQTVDAGAFEVLPQQKQLLAEQTVSMSADAQTVLADTISVTIPGDALEKEQTVRIEQIENPNTINLPETVTGTAFSVTVGNVHQFDDIVLIDFELPADMPGEPSAAYFNENTSLWDTLPSEVVDGKLCIYTDHLTDFLVFYWGKAIYSSDGCFKIYYHENDKHTYGSSMDDLAQKVGSALEEARKGYNKLPEAYREDFSYLGMKDSMDVYLASGNDDATYTPMTNNILLPTDFTSIDDLETTAAHELFHAYQDTVWNEFGVVGKMGRGEHKWAVEALAELAAYELAFPQKERLRLLNKGVHSQNSYNTVDNVHEYNMSCFLRYLLRETNSKFDDLWISVASSGKSNLDVCINDFFRSKSNDFISMDMSYMDFWKDVMGDADAPKHEHPEVQFSRRQIYLGKNQHTAEFKYTGKASTTAFNLFAVKSFCENIPLRIFNVECGGSQSTSAMCVNLSGIQNPKYLNNLRISGGHLWSHIYADASLGDTHLLYTLEQGKQDMVLIGLESVQPDTLHSVKISEIQAQCNPQRIEKAVPGREQEFTVAFKDIFPHVSEMELIIDFGDGTVRKFSNTNETGTFGGKITHTFGDNVTGKAVTFSLYNVSGGGRELISALAIPMTTGEAVILSARPNPAEPGDAVSLSTNIAEAGYTYQWNFGDGATDTAVGTAYTSRVYEKPGAYTASVTVLDADGKCYGKAQTTVTVTGPEVTPTPSPTSEATLAPSPAKDYSYLYGTWTASSGVILDMRTNDTWRFVATLVLNEDGTCYYNISVSIVYKREDDPDPYPPIPPHDSTGTMWENESNSGKYGIYEEEGVTGNIGGIEFGDGSGGYIGYNGENLYFDSMEFAKSG